MTEDSHPMVGLLRDLRRHLMQAGVVAAALASMLLTTAPAFASTGQPGSPDTAVAAACKRNSPPSWFYTELRRAARVPGDQVPSSWGNSRDIGRIVLAESNFCPTASNGQFYGLGQMNRAAVVNEAGVSWQKYVHGTSAHKARYYQLLAALRYCEHRYHTPQNAWAFRQANGYW
jgi:hypothetical protein